MNQIHFVGGPWDGALIPWHGGDPPANVRMPNVPTELASPYKRLPAGPYCYRLETGDAGSVYRYIGRSDIGQAPAEPAR
jgi:hypothetical protein